jgi:hypothetical protein
MTTHREIISKVKGVLKLNNRDEHMSSRFILKLLKDTASTLISQKWMDRTILGEMNLYTVIPCFEFEQIDSRNCGLIEFRMCKTLMKSKKPLPKLIFSRLGASIKDIVSLDGDFKFTIVDKSQYQRNQKRRFNLKNEVYVYLDADNYLYIPDHEILTVDLTILTLDTEKVEDCSECKKQNCKSYLDSEFKCPDKLLSTVFTETLKLAGMSINIKSDQNPNNAEGT